MPSARKSCASILIALGVHGALGCASRSVPDALPKTSAASTTAPETPRETVTAALDMDPPLPGSEDKRWPGLQARPASVPADQAHEGHGGGEHAP